MSVSEITQISRLTQALRKARLILTENGAHTHLHKLEQHLLSQEQIVLGGEPCLWQRKGLHTETCYAHADTSHTARSEGGLAQTVCDPHHDNCLGGANRRARN